MSKSSVFDFILGAIVGSGLCVVLFSVGCTGFKAAKHATYLCEPACEELSAVTVDRCYSLCSSAMAGSEAMAYIGLCESGCREAVSLGEPQCVESCEAGVKEALKRIDVNR